MAKKIVILLVLVIVIAAGAYLLIGRDKNQKGGSQPTPTPTEAVLVDFLTYENSENGIKIKYPKDWEKQEAAGGASVVFLSQKESEADAFRDNVSVVIQDLSSQPMTLEEYSNVSISSFPSFVPNFQQIELKDVTVAKNPGKKIAYTGKLQDYNVKVIQVWTIKNNDAYILTYLAAEENYSKYLDLAEKVINSFEITK